MVAVPVGLPFLVNGVAPGKQYRPVISSLANGGFVIAWQDDSGQGAETDDAVRYAMYDALGVRLTAAGTDLIANTTIASAQFEASVGRFADGKFVIVWTDASETNPDFDNRAVRGQVFNADGSKSGSEFIVNSTFPLSQDEPSVAVLTNGKFIVTWSSEIVTNSGATNIIGRLFNDNGSPSGSEFTINSQTAGNQVSSEVHALSNGGFAVVWDDEDINPATGNEIKTFIRFYNASGSPTSGSMSADSALSNEPKEVSFAELANGSIVVVYSDYDFNSSDGSGAGVKARIYNPVANLFGSLIDVNTTTLNDQYDAQVAALPDGQFVVVWTDNSKTGLDTSFEAVRMQVFTATGAKVGSEILVNSAALFEQKNPTITVLADGRFVVAWEDNSQTGLDTQALAIRARIYDARIVGIDLDGTEETDNYVGSQFADTINGFGGADKITGGGGIDIIFGGPGLDLLFGDEGNDELTGGEGNDELTGGAGADTLNGGIGVDTMAGGPGDDLYFVGIPGDTVIELVGEGFDTVSTSSLFTLGAGQEIEVLETTNPAANNAFNLNGNEFGQSIRGNAGVNVINGFSGNDFLAGLGGADTLIGGIGVDTADYTDKATAVVVFLNGGTNATVTVGGVAEDTIREIERVNGGTNDDSLVGDGLANLLNGANGNDNLFSNGFNPDGTLKINAGSDVLNGGAGDDGLFGGDGADTLNGGANNDGVVGGAGADTLNGDAGNDFLFGGAFSSGGAQLANSGADTLNGGAGNDGLYGFDGVDAINGDGDNDYVEGGGGNDTINGGAGSDYLLGQGEADTINGGTGFDYLYGGLGGDTFIFRKLDSADWILDFSAAQGDKLRFLDFGYANFAAVPLVDLSTPGNPAVQLTFSGPGGVDQLTIFGVTLAQLNVGNVLVT